MNEFYNSVQGLMFKDVDDLFARKMEIREKYLVLDYPTKQIYKWFFYYQLCLLRNPLKRLLWDFINGSNDLQTIWDLSNEYKKFCNKRNKIYPKNEETILIKVDEDESNWDSWL